MIIRLLRTRRDKCEQAPSPRCICSPFDFPPVQPLSLPCHLERGWVMGGKLTVYIIFVNLARIAAEEDNAVEKYGSLVVSLLQCDDYL